MSAQLHVLIGPDKGRSFALLDGTTTQVGRGSTTATQLTDPAVSRLHCEIACAGRAVTLMNRSDSGTQVNGEAVETHALRHGDLVRIGNTTMRYYLTEMEEAETMYQQP